MTATKPAPAVGFIPPLDPRHAAEIRFHETMRFIVKSTEGYRVVAEKVTGTNNGTCRQCGQVNTASEVHWVDDAHGYPFAGPFDTVLCANAWLAEFRDLLDRRREAVQRETEERMRRPIDPDELYGKRA